MKRKINKILPRNHNKYLILYIPKEQLGVLSLYNIIKLGASLFVP